MTPLGPFALFALSETFAVDLDVVNQRYTDRMRELHPDRFVNRSAAERRVAQQWSSAVNRAFTILRSPIRRATWLIEHRAPRIRVNGHQRMSPRFLLRQMQWRRALEDAQTTPERLQKLRQRAQDQLQAGVVQLRVLIDKEHNYEQAAELTRRLMFIEKFIASLPEQK